MLHSNHITSYARVHSRLKALRAAELRTAAQWPLSRPVPNGQVRGRLAACPVCLGPLRGEACPECHRSWETPGPR